MGATNFYGLPYPDAGSTVDVPRDVKALADKLELWKNGFTVPSGNVRVGMSTDVALFSLAVQRFLSPAAIEANLSIFNSAGGMAYLAVNKDGALQWAYTFDQNGQIGTRDPSNVVRPLPFSCYATTKTLAFPNVANMSAVITFPSGRFTQSPAILVQPIQGGGLYFGYVTAGNKDSATCGARHFDNTLTSNTVTLSILCLQSVSTGPEPNLAVMGDEATHVATCRTAGCENEDAALSIVYPDDASGVFCGPCGNEITDIE